MASGVFLAVDDAVHLSDQGSDFTGVCGGYRTELWRPGVVGGGDRYLAGEGEHREVVYAGRYLNRRTTSAGAHPGTLFRNVDQPGRRCYRATAFRSVCRSTFDLAHHVASGGNAAGLAGSHDVCGQAHQLGGDAAWIVAGGDVAQLLLGCGGLPIEQFDWCRADSYMAGMSYSQFEASRDVRKVWRAQRMIGDQDEVEVPLSFAQERMFILSKAEADPALYNVHRVALSRQIKENPSIELGRTPGKGVWSNR